MDFNKLAIALLRGEPKRSQPFLEGLAAVLRNRIDQTLVTSPYAQGSVEDDAFYAGRLRAHNEFRNALIEAGGNRYQAIQRLQQIASAAAEQEAA
ncbi:MAG: hypothetical protein IBJ08_17725 [Pseudomonas sp.]|jgi:hypothetical protein|nr:hypothetical protein [Pseudomonas sp.]